LLPGSLKEKLETTLSNGLDWNQENSTMYYIDTHAYNLYTLTYNKQDGSLADQKVLIDYTQDSELAFPDGMCVDSSGRLWVASFGGQRVTCWNPQTKERVMTLNIPGAKRITSCCFGGPGYAWLFVTSARYGASAEELAKNPNSGAVFVIKDLGTHGMPAHKFKL
jgi:sugar lactone lactonase YvrE